MQHVKSGIKRLLAAKGLLRVMGAQSLSTYANQIIAFVVPWLVLTRTHSAASAGMVAFAMGVASVVGILSGGVVTDRIGGRKVSMIADSLSLVTAVFLAGMLFADTFSLWLVIVSQIVGVFFDGPGSIAKNTMVPASATAENVPMARAMGLQQTLQNVAMFAGPLSAGLLIALLTESWTLVAASVLFLACVVLVGRFQRQTFNHEHPMTVRRAYADMVDAVKFLIREPFLGPMQLFGPLYAFVVGPISTIVFPAWFVFAHQSSAHLGVFLGAQAIGGMIGGFIFAAYGPKVSQHKWLFGATVAYALALGGLSFLQAGSVAAIVIGFLAGVSFTGLLAIPFTAFYTRTPQGLLGRVNSLGAAAGFAVISLGGLFFGWLISATSPQIALVVCAIWMGMMAVGVMALPFMKHLDEPSRSSAGQ